MTGFTLLRDLLLAGRMPLAAAQGNADDAAGKSHIEAVRFLVHMQREDALVVLAVRQTPGNGSEKPDQRLSWQVASAPVSADLIYGPHSGLSQSNRIFTCDSQGHACSLSHMSSGGI